MPLQLPEEEACAGLTVTSAALNGLKNTFKLLSIGYNLLKVASDTGPHQFEAGGVKKLDYYEVWDELTKHSAHNR